MILPGIDPSLFIGVSSIDKEHYDLLSQFNALNSDIDLSAHSARFSEALSRLGQKISTHFDNEEKIFMSSEMSVDAMLAHVQAHLLPAE